MPPKFVTSSAWQQAELLMQPVFIRVIDNLRKELEQSSWRGNYHESPLWTKDITEATKSTITSLQTELQTASPERSIEIQEELARLPQSHPGYYLTLEKSDREVTIDLWQLCYQICFRNYNSIVNTSDNPVVEVDTSLIEADTGQVDWLRLDVKTKQVIAQIFANLPKIESETTSQSSLS